MIVFSWPIPYYFDRELDHAELEETIGSGLEWLESWLIAGTDLDYLVEGTPPIRLVDAGRALAQEVVSRWDATACVTAPAAAT